MRYTKVLLTILVLGTLFIVGCGGGETKAPVGGAYIGGTQGVTAEFEAFSVEEEGVFSLFDSETFPLEVTLRNKGEYELKSGDATVKLLGPSPDEFEGIPSWELKNSDVVDTISDLVPAGGEETINFASDAKYKNEVAGFIDREWFANIEYNYETYVIIPEVCLKEDLSDDRVCDVTGAKTFFVSGAPVTITSVTEEPAGKGIMAIKLVVSNVAGGKVAKQGEEFGVRDELTYSIDDSAWECKSGGKVNEARLQEGSAEIICKLKEALSEGSLSTKQVKLTLSYLYRDIIQETLRIKESAR